MKETHMPQGAYRSSWRQLSLLTVALWTQQQARLFPVCAAWGPLQKANSRGRTTSTWLAGTRSIADDTSSTSAFLPGREGRLVHIQEQVISSFGNSPCHQPPMAQSVLCGFSSEYFSPNVTYVQPATQCRIEGYESFLQATKYWDDCFETADAQPEAAALSQVELKLQRSPSWTSPTTLRVAWNLTYVTPNPTVWFLQETVAPFAGWDVTYQTYLHLSGTIQTFSYVALARYFLEAAQRKHLKLPLVCIEGVTTLEWRRTSQPSKEDKNDDTLQIHRITEEWNLAQDLNRGVLLYRRCAEDLRLFLETGRPLTKAIMEQQDITKKPAIGDWYDLVAAILPWTSVPGMGALDILPNGQEVDSDDETWVPVAFLVVSALVLKGFASIAAPELIGQSLFGPPAYIVPPSELNSIY